jgi:SpoVK/Ycf46/Vps4 family AAA+-type ATPase
VATKVVDSLGLLALALGQSETAIWEHLNNGQLMRLQLLHVGGTGNDNFCYYLSRRLMFALLPPHRDIDATEQALMGRRQVTRLRPEDYAHIAPTRDFVRRLLRSALDNRSPGINILLHGAPGTGKTEFCRVMADMLDCDLYAVGEADLSGDEMQRDERIDALRLADCLAARRGRTLLLFDEMEDILQAGDRTVSSGQHIRRAGSKIFFNRLLESNAAPVLWTTNSICEFDPAFLRRMTFIIEMKPLPRHHRMGLWRQAAARHGLDLTEEQAQHLSRRHAVAPAQIAGALGAVAMAGGTPQEIDFVLASMPGGDNRNRMQSGRAQFQLDLANADLDLERLTASLSRPDAPKDVSFCFYGPPGTGKSAYARSLAEAMGLEPVVKKGSDLLGKWVGETERNLAEAFEEARREQGFLIIDEAENFLWQRGGAQHSWEVSMVNELLVQMENTAVPFACTTNHLEALDPAALRRFSFKVKFDFMQVPQTRRAYQQFFGAVPPDRLDRLSGLTPGDFAVVARKAKILDLVEGNACDMVDLLAQECAAKNLPRRIGF